VAIGTAPAGSRPLALCYGSDLLPLRLRSVCSRAMWFFTPLWLRRLTSFARLAHSPRSLLLFAPCSIKSGPCGGVVPPGLATAFWSPQ
jgi:hypothetical protein